MPLVKDTLATYSSNGVALFSSCLHCCPDYVSNSVLLSKSVVSHLLLMSLLLTVLTHSSRIPLCVSFLLRRSLVVMLPVKVSLFLVVYFFFESSSLWGPQVSTLFPSS